MLILSIDPSINRVGWAVHNTENNMMRYGMITSVGETVEEKLSSIKSHLINEVIRHEFIAAVVIEDSFIYFGNHAGKGRVNPQSIRLLSLSVGYIAGVCAGYAPKIEFIAPSAWKGTKSKAATIRECKAQGITWSRNGRSKELPDHVADAIRLGQWFIGKMKKNERQMT